MVLLLTTAGGDSRRRACGKGRKSLKKIRPTLAFFTPNSIHLKARAAMVLGRRIG